MYLVHLNRTAPFAVLVGPVTCMAGTSRRRNPAAAAAAAAAVVGVVVGPNVHVIVAVIRIVVAVLIAFHYHRLALHGRRGMILSMILSSNVTAAPPRTPVPPLRG